MDTGLHNKAVIVTGGASNVGRGIVLAFAREGARIAILDVDERQGGFTADDARALDASETLVIKCDVTRPDEVAQAIEATAGRFGTVDVLVNNVGWPDETPLLSQTAGMVDREIALNVRGMINCIQAVLPIMIGKGTGSIVNIGSEAGLKGDPDHIVYSACKGAVAAMTRALARNVGKYGIRVNCVAPHVVMPTDPETEAGEGSMFHLEKGQYGQNIASILASSEIRQAIISDHALSRLGKASDIGAAVVFLASDLTAGYITGQTLSVNGGDFMG